MRLELTDREDLVSKLKQTSATHPRLIVIDGVHGAGQDAMAEVLSRTIGGRVRQVDPGEASSALSTEVLTLKKTETVILSGVMMLQALAEADLRADVHIYLVPSQSNPRRAFWEGILSKPLNQYLAELDDDLDRQTVRYHWQTHPVINADYLVEGG